MKKLFILLMFVSGYSYSQYYPEMTTEKSFENSALYFNSHFLNTFGMFNFKQLSAGFISDPYLDLYLNPANLPKLKKDAQVYLDFRGDWTEPDVINYYPVMPLYSSYLDVRSLPYPDPRWITTTRTEPEPIVSVGVLLYPFSGNLENLFIGGTYQIIYEEDGFYQTPYSIYNSNYYYDVFGGRLAEKAEIPITDRYSGIDEFINQGHLYSVFLGYRFSEDLSLGLSLNGVSQSRAGEYSNSSNYDYSSTTEKNVSTSSYSQSKNQDYDHLDISSGISYNINGKTTLGLKVGVLKGKAVQDYMNNNSSFYSYNYPDTLGEYSYNISNSKTDQGWTRDGNTKYISFNFTSLLKENKEISGFYRYTNGDLDLKNHSTLNDSSAYSGKWTDSYNNNTYRYEGSQFLNDIRSGSGEINSYTHEGLAKFKWPITESIDLNIGLYYSNNKTETFTSEPVNSIRESVNSHSDTNPDRFDNYSQKLLEEKTLEWRHISKSWSLQIPVLFDFRFSKAAGMMLGLSRILNGWEIRDETLAIIDLRQKTENGVIGEQKYFGERYVQPTKKITENFFDLVTSFYVNIGEDFTLRVLIDPEVEPEIRIAQWWMSFSANI